MFFCTHFPQVVQVELWTLTWQRLTDKAYKQVYFSCCLIFLSTATSHKLKRDNFLMLKLESSKLIIPYLNHIQQPRFVLFVMLNISQFFRNIFGGGLVPKLPSLHPVTFFTVNTVTDGFLHILKSFQKLSSLKPSSKHILSMSKSEHMLSSATSSFENCMCI